MPFEPVILGKTGIKVGKLGIASAYGTPTQAVEEAFDHGVNYLFWGSPRTEKMGEGIRRIAKKNRDKAVVVIQTYMRSPFLIRRSLEKGLKKLGLDYADILLFGWFNKRPSQKTIDVALELKEKGLCRFIGLSSHHRPVFPLMDKEDIFDIFHVRYSAAHTGGEKDIFPHLRKENPTGIVSFTATRWGKLLKDSKMPKGEKTPTAVDCYRFAMSNPNIHVTISAVKNIEQMRQNLKALELGPMNDEELAWMRRVGDYVHG
ncbi:aldo/keto reductase [candidate division KSB1 bacterium]